MRLRKCLRSAVRFVLVPATIPVASAVAVYATFAIADPNFVAAQIRQQQPFVDYPAAWERLARDGDTEAQFLLGLLHSDGSGVTLDYEKAYFWYHEAARRNHLDAQYNLAHLYLKGNGVEKDPARAIYWWHKAARHGHVRSQYNLGFAYYRGIGTAQDYQQALIWIRRAAQRNDSRALNLLKVLEEKTMSAPGLPENVGDSTLGRSVTARKTVVAKVEIPPERATPARAVDDRRTQNEFESTHNNSWLFSQPTDYYTAQLISSKKKSDVNAYVARHGLQHRIRMFETKRDGEEWWYVLFGSYPTRHAATAAVVSANIEADTVWIRGFAGLHKRRCQMLAASQSAVVGRFCP